MANKLCALFGRAEVHDYIDVYGVLRDGRYSGSEMLRDHDPGFDRQVFAEALRAVLRFPDSAFDPYRLSPDEIVTLCNHLLAWADEIACLNQ
ncbi:hypothetical protein ACFHWS_05455 [Micromonospora sp. LOL_013]|uniref:hypothetical protein n=1 Tax=Micromonospora sp. LOL_013 TaxID=3345414 RepID=UPI003A889217